MNNADLIKARITAFLYEAGTFLLIGVLGYLSSDEFSGIVKTHFGETIIATGILLVVSGLVKHIRNLQVLKKLGAGDRNVVLI